MQATRTPPGRAPAVNPRHRSTQSPPAPRPAGPGPQIPATQSEAELPSPLGDAIDDRIAEILDELPQERNAARPHRRLPRVLGAAGLILALTTSVLLWHNAPAAWTTWPATAGICLAIAWAGSTRRP